MDNSDVKTDASFQEMMARRKEILAELGLDDTQPQKSKRNPKVLDLSDTAPDRDPLAEEHKRRRQRLTECVLREYSQDWVIGKPIY